ncbi:DNase I-like protein [Apiospora sp. TS-2023a]
MSRTSISPPPLKRQKRTKPSPGIAGAGASPVFSPPITPTMGTLRIFSWNVNGIAPFFQPYLQKSIKSFFGASAITPSSVSGRKRRRSVVEEEAGVDVITESDSDGGGKGHPQGRSDGEDNPSKEGEASLRKVLKRYGWPQILFLQEVKIKPGNDKTQNAVRVAINDAQGSAPKIGATRLKTTRTASTSSDTEPLADGGPGYDAFFNLPADPHNAKGFGGKVYGVATIIRKDFMNSHVKEVRDATWDREGRVQVIETKDLTFPLDHEETNAEHSGNSTCKLAIFNIYAVNGTTNLYRSTYTGAPAGTRHDRKLAFHADLFREACLLESQGYSVIIAGDLNVAPDERDGHPNLRTFPVQHVRNRADFSSKFLSHNLINTAPNEALYKPASASPSKTDNPMRQVGMDGIDTFRHVHGSERRYSYHPRGQPWGSSYDRVDLIVVSRTLENGIVDAGICDSPPDRGPSDHCPVWVEIGGSW